MEPEVDSSYSAPVFPPKSDCALRKQTCGKTDSARDSKDGAPSPKRATIKKETEVDDNESSSSTGLSDETLRDHRFTVYGRDSTAVHEVRAKILSLEAETRPSRQDIDSSPIFALRRAADESWPPSIIGKHWVPYLEQKGHLVDCKPKDFSYKDRWLPLYTRAGVTKHLSGLESLLNKDKTSPLIAVILPEMDFQYEREYVIHKLHKSKSLNRIEDRILFLFKFPVSNICSGQSCWPSIQSLFLTSILATWIRLHSSLSPIYQGRDGIIKHSFNSRIWDLA